MYSDDDTLSRLPSNEEVAVIEAMFFADEPVAYAPPVLEPTLDPALDPDPRVAPFEQEYDSPVTPIGDPLSPPAPPLPAAETQYVQPDAPEVVAPVIVVPAVATVVSVAAPASIAVDVPRADPNAGPPGYSFVGWENAAGTFTEPTDIAYGANGQFAFLNGVTGAVRFDNTTFGDPIFGTFKAAYAKKSSSSRALLWLGLAGVAAALVVANRPRRKRSR